MKKIYLGLLLSSALFGINAANAAVTLNGDTVYFKGYVLQASCKISYDGLNGQTVYLPLTQASDWATGSETSNKTKSFAIKLKDCADDYDLKNYTEPDVYRKVSWVVTSGMWEAKNGVGTLNLIKNTGSANNVSIFLRNTDSSNPNSAVTATNYKFKSSPSDDDVYNFEAGYSKTYPLLAPGSGSVSGSATFNVVYE